MNKFFSLCLAHLPKRGTRDILTIALLAVGLGFGALSFAPAAQAASLAQPSSVAPSAGAMTAAGTFEGCPVRYACIYPEGKGWNGGHPSLMYYYYDVYQLNNQTGDHYLYNNQTGGAWFYLCRDSYGKTCPWYVPNRGPGYQANLTPVYSVKLAP